MSKNLLESASEILAQTKKDSPEQVILDLCEELVYLRNRVAKLEAKRPNSKVKSSNAK